MKFLIVDDDPTMRRLLRRIVSDSMDVVYECEDATLALAEYTEREPDWVLMDVEMKLTDGLMVTRQLVAAYPQAKVVIVTRHDDELLRSAAQSAGAYACVIKDDLLALRKIIKSGNPGYPGIL